MYIPCLDYKDGELNFMNLLNGAGEVTLKSVKYIPDLLLRRYVYVPYMNSTVQYSTVQYSTVQYSTVQYSTQYKQLISLRSLYILFFCYIDCIPLGRLEHANSLTGKL